MGQCHTELIRPTGPPTTSAWRRTLCWATQARRLAGRPIHSNQLASVGAYGLLGLYTGVPRTAYGAEHALVTSKITIFRGAHLRQFRDPDSLARGVAETVRHEVAHHFGISDARLAELARGRR